MILRRKSTWLFMASLLATVILTSYTDPLAAENPALVRALQIRAAEYHPDSTVDLYVASIGGDGEPIRNIDRPNWSITDTSHSTNYEISSLKAFPDSGKGRTTLVAIDTSGSMAKGIPTINAALRDWSSRLRENIDFMALGTVADDWEMLQDLTTEPSAIETSLEKYSTQPSATTALFEAIHLGVEFLSRKSPTEFPIRRSLLVISDGLNEKLGRTADECITAARAARIEINSLIYLPSRSAKALRAKGELEKISRDSGGVTFTVTNAEDLRSALAEISRRQDSETVATVKIDPIVNAVTKLELNANYGTLSQKVSLQVPASNFTQGTSATSRMDWLSGTSTPKKVGLGIAILAMMVGAWFLRRRGGDQPLDTKDGSPASAPVIPAANIQPADPEPSEKLKAGAHRRNRTQFRSALSNDYPVSALIVVDGLERGRSFPLSSSDAVIGRADSCDIVIPDDSVSGRHCKIIYASGVNPSVIDLNSTNGTFIDGRRVNQDPVQVNKGSQIRIGTVILRVE